MKAWDFSGDEAFILIASAMIAVTGTSRSLHRLAKAISLRPNFPHRVAMLAGWVACAGFMAVMVWNYSDPVYVAGHVDYFVLFMACGLAGLVVTLLVTSWLGADWHRNGVVAGNSAAIVVCLGAMIGWSIIYAGANYGAGPTVETTLAPAIAAGIWLALTWMIIDAMLSFSLSDAVALDRDLASGLRLAGCLIASSIILGRACAGDWWSWENTWSDFFGYGWPIVVVFFATGVMQLWWGPTVRVPVRDRARFGLMPAAVLVLIAIVYVSCLPPPELGKHIVTWEQYTGEKE